MVTGERNSLVAQIHPEAKATILALEDHEPWLGGCYDRAVALRRPFLSDWGHCAGRVSYSVVNA